MNRLTRSAIVLALAALAGPVAGATLHEPFEQPLAAPWAVGADLPHDPDLPDGAPVASQAIVSDENVFAGSGALRLYIDGLQDDGTLWVVRPVRVDQATPEVRLRFQFFSPFGGTFNHLADAVAYIGARPPRAEEDFARLAPVTEIDRWQTLSHTARVDAAAGDTVWVALGFSVVWESEQTYYVDDVLIDVGDPATAVSAASWARLKERFGN